SVHARRNAQLDGAFALEAALPAAIGAPLTNNLTRALACGASACNGEESLLIGKLTAATAGLTRRDPGACFRARAVASFTVFLARELDFGSYTSKSFLKGERHVVAQISAALDA